MICSIISLIGLLGGYCYENYLEKRKNFYLEKGLPILFKPENAGELLTRYKLEQQDIFHEKMIAQYKIANMNFRYSSYSKDDIWLVLIKIFRNDEISYRFDNKWSKNGLRRKFENMGFDTPKKISDFLIENSLTKQDSLYITEAKNNIGSRSDFLDLVDKYENKLDNLDYEKIFFQILVMLSLLFFPFRYLVYMTIWSIKQLKIKE